MLRTTAVLTGALLLLTLAGCGTQDEETAAQSLSASLAKGGQFGNKPGDADCIGEELVASVGVEKLQKSGLLTQDLQVDESIGDINLSREDAADAAEAIAGCTDVEALYEELLTSSADLTPAVRKCVTDFVTEETVRKVLAAEFAGDTSAREDLLQQPMIDCAAKR